MNSIPKTVIGLATYGRPTFLRKCLESLSALKVPKGHVVHLILVDNNTEPTAQGLFESVKYPFDSSYHHETNKGIVHARNRILKEALAMGANNLAFIDDDEWVAEEWLVEGLIELKDDYSVVTGPCQFHFPTGTPRWVPQTRVFKEKSTTTGPYNGTSSTRNVLFNLDETRKQNLRFEEKLNWIGGSDTYFFIQLKQSGARTYWTEKMRVSEQIPADRANLKWILKRNIRMGSGRVARELLQKSTLHVWMREVSVALWFILAGLFRATVLGWFKFGFIRGIEKAMRGIGILKALFGRPYEEYKNA